MEATIYKMKPLCKQIDCRDLGEREPGMAFLTQVNSFWPKPSQNKFTMLALEQVLVINDLKGTRECRNREKAVKR